MSELDDLLRQMATRTGLDRRIRREVESMVAAARAEGERAGAERGIRWGHANAVDIDQYFGVESPNAYVARGLAELFPEETPHG